MRTIPLTFLLTSLLLTPAMAQKRTAPKKEATFAEAVETAKKAFDAQDHGAAISALQEAIRAVQKLQRTAILAALPKPDGWEVTDDEPVDTAANPFAAGMAAWGLTVQRHYRKDDKSIDVEVTANSPAVQMFAVMLSNPALAKADGGEIVEYTNHKALLKKSGDSSIELTLIMHEKHLVKFQADGLTADELLAIADEAMVGRLEKPLGK